MKGVAMGSREEWGLENPVLKHHPRGSAVAAASTQRT